MNENIKSYRGHYYVLFENGYKLVTESGKVILSQLEPYAKIFLPDGTYEENAKAHIDSIVDAPEPVPSDTESMRADIDYIALMTDLVLPSQETEEKEGE